ncbi:MAG: DNA polymerase III subunit beta [Leptospiraceae bacterium]|nr:DNA polymerase III subunit beta [Leptospiraceae bacterium]
MKFEVNQNDFFKSIAITESIISTREIRSIISSIHLEAKDDILTLTSTDLEIGIKTRLAARVLEPGSIALPAKKLSQSIREFRAEKILFSITDDTKVSLTDAEGTSKAHITLVGTSSSEYPPLPTMNEKEFTAVPPELLIEMIRKTIYSVATEDQRFVFNGLFIKNIGNKVDFVATDGRRLSLIQRDFPSELPFQAGIIVPNKAIRELQKLLEASLKTKVGYNAAEKQIHFRIGQIDFISKLLDGQYPDYNMVIPKTLEHSVTIDKAYLESCLKQVSVMATEPSKQVKLSFQKDALTISASTPDIGEADDQLDIDYDGDEVLTSFNANYILDIIKVIRDEKLAFAFSNSGSPAVIKDQGDPEFTAVIMPMKV